MKNRGPKITITVVAMILLGITAFLLHDYFYEFLYNQFRDLDVHFFSPDLNIQGKKAYTFATVISILPGLFLFAHFILKDQKSNVFLIIVPITLLCGIALMMFHIYSLRAEIQEYSNPAFMNFRSSFNISNIHAARYLGIGFILGTIFSTAIISFTSRDRKS